MPIRGSGSQVNNGKSLEWAIAQNLKFISGVEISQGSAAITAAEKYNLISDSLRQRQMLASKLAIDHIFTRELISDFQGNSSMLAISQDFLGQSGDVRDVIIKGESKTIGFSCKNNHRAFKHSRLSGSIDFVRQWGISRSGASPIYWNAVKPIFAKLST